ncbi:unnamed protein product (macronuclear) [Paramecium tetraurelia]|uniref:Protein kinase domain-containing protein n=1 Tax=Paramecium tetraurelia TaxID=5888 RepID=A0BIU3_PARTE|nr:uncharacterized protein GSPATT00004832001 [Paramecium tetraurelia]CAK58460.1 unnamed protein product [Paramecium tetraurelia]|eukprot:XP_001425858.1 hypothetical protein (macronuclear) [Paramecium tetraurelia strain d4-2]
MDKKGNFEKLRQKLQSDLFKNENHQKQQTDEIINQCPQILDYVHCSSQSELKEVPTKLIDVLSNQKQLEQMKQSFQNQYQVGKTLGEGAHAVVRQCWQITNPDETYAVKITRNPDPEITEIMKQTFLNTVSLNHPYICQTNMLYIDPNMECSYLVMEYLPYPSLQQILKERQKLQFEEVRLITRQLFEAVSYLHQVGLCHRDIKPDNIVFDSDSNSIKLIDFGVSKRFLVTEKGCKDIKNNLMWTVTGTMPYQAPELWKGTGYSNKIDIWAIGVVCYQMLCAKLPLDQANQMESFSTQTEYTGHFQDEQFAKLPPLIIDFVKRILKWDPEKRITSQEALLHPWLYQSKLIPTHFKGNSKDDNFSSSNDKPLLALLRSMQANAKIFSQSVSNANENCIDKTDFNKNHGQIIIGLKETSQQIRDKSIHFQQSIHSMNLNKCFSKPNTDDVKDLFDVISYCDSNSSFEDLEEKPYIQTQKQNKQYSYNNKKWHFPKESALLKKNMDSFE